MNNGLSNVINEVEAIVNYVESNICSRFDLKMLSKTIYLSKFHMLRTFKAVTGQGIIEYANLRRLSLSLNDLIRSERTISYIGDKYCFAGSQSYIRAFRKAFGITPLAYRKNPSELKIYDRFNTTLLQKCGDGVIIEPIIKVVPHFCIMGIPYNINDLENCEKSIAPQMAADFWLNKRHEIEKPMDENVYIGYSYVQEAFEHENKKERCVLYIPSMMVHKDAPVPEGMQKTVIDTHQCAVFKYIGNHNIFSFSRNMILDLWDYIHDIWMPSVALAPTGRYAYEQVDLSLCRDSFCEFLIYVPVKPI